MNRVAKAIGGAVATVAVTATLSFGLLAQSGAAPSGAPTYLGFDSRLEAEPLFRHSPPQQTHFVAGSKGLLFVSPGSLVWREGSSAAKILLPGGVRSALTDAAGDLWLDVGSGLARLGAKGFENALFEPGDKTRFFSSGASRMLRTTEASGAVTFAVVDATTRDSPGLLTMPGELRCAEWSDNGLAAVVDDTLLVLRSGAKAPQLLDKSDAYKDCFGLLLLDDGRVLVAVDHALLLTAERYRHVVAVMRARLARRSTDIFVSDQRNGIVWQVRGTERVGPRAKDLEHAQRLNAKALVDCGPASPCPARDEARRILQR